VTPSANSLDQHLGKLLSQDPEVVGARRTQLFDRLQKESSGDGTVVLMGAGNLGRRVLETLRRHNKQVLAFCDNNPSAQGKKIDGIPVLSPDQAASQFGQHATFVVTMLNPDQNPRTVLHQLKQLSCRVTMMILPLAWKYPEQLLPNFFLDLPEKIIAETKSVLAGFYLLDDEESRREYVQQIDWRLAGNLEPAPVSVDHAQYFPKTLFALQADEVFVDCGAFDGDTVNAFLVHSQRKFQHIDAFEPDPQTFARLELLIQRETPTIRDRIRARRFATGATAGSAKFAATGLASAALSDKGDIEVPVRALDELIELAPTFIKMDIEGAELDTLAGARNLIRNHRPVLAICAYHAQDHLWRVPLTIAAMAPRYRLFLRRYAEWQFDTVCYGIPQERLLRRV
jgi:FkbM family methyltransferase